MPDSPSDPRQLLLPVAIFLLIPSAALLAGVRDQLFGAAVAVGLSAAVICWVVPFVYREVRAVNRADRVTRGLCGRCGYDLRASAGRCPECGEEIPKEPLEQTPMVKRVIAETERYAAGRGQGYVGTEHVLLALLREHDGVAAQALLNFGVTEEEFEAAVDELLGHGGDATGAS